MNTKIVLVCLMSCIPFMGLNAMLMRFITVEPGMELPRAAFSRNVAAMIKQHVVDLDESDEEFESFLVKLEAHLRAHTIFINQPFIFDNEFGSESWITLNRYCAELRPSSRYKNRRLARVITLLENHCDVTLIHNEDDVGRRAPLNNVRGVPSATAEVPGQRKELKVVGDQQLTLEGIL